MPPDAIFFLVWGQLDLLNRLNMYLPKLLCVDPGQDISSPARYQSVLPRNRGSFNEAFSKGVFVSDLATE